MTFVCRDSVTRGAWYSGDVDAGAHRGSARRTRSNAKAGGWVRSWHATGSCGLNHEALYRALATPESNGSIARTKTELILKW